MHGITSLPTFTYGAPYGGLYDTVNLSGHTNPRIDRVVFNGSNYSSTLMNLVSSTGLFPFNKNLLMPAPYNNLPSFTSTTGLFSSYFTDEMCKNNTGFDLLINFTGTYYNHTHNRSGVNPVLTDGFSIFSVGAGMGFTPADILITIYNSSNEIIDTLRISGKNYSRPGGSYVDKFIFNVNFCLKINNYFKMEIDMKTLWYIPYLRNGTIIRAAHFFENFKFTTYKYNLSYAAYSYYLQEPTIANIISI
jgi:hypothetical protein